MDNLTAFLQQVEIFSLLSTKEIDIIIPGLRFYEINSGDIIFKEGGEGDELFIVKEGRVASSVMLPNGNKREIAEFKTGDFFGEMTIFENAPRSATCFAKEKSMLISLHERDFFELILFYPDIAVKVMYRMLNIITGRLDEKSKFLTNMVHWGEEARMRAVTDEVTGIYNRRFLDDALEDYFKKAKKSNQPLSVIMVDIDNFKDIGENFESKIVNQVVAEIATAFKKHLRKQDIFARYGGDEFAVILPETNLDEAMDIAENARMAVEELSLSGIFENPIPKVTICLGISSYPDNAEDLKTLLQLADRSLYRAKLEGKNKVVSARA